LAGRPTQQDACLPVGRAGKQALLVQKIEEEIYRLLVEEGKCFE
jgi:hypothetical protein